MNNEELKLNEKEFIMNTYGRFNLVIDNGKGIYVYDKDGKEYLDFIGGIACVSVGHGNKKVCKAIAEQAKRLIHVSNLYYTEPQVVLAEKLVKLSGLKKCFFCNSGAEANEAAIKLAKKITKKTHFIVCEHAFHGRTHGSLAATWKQKYKEPFMPLVDGFKFVEYNNVKAIEDAITDKTAAVMLEPIQGEAGVIVPNNNYLKNVLEICRKKGVLLILDEVQSGNGKTGKFFAYQHSLNNNLKEQSNTTEVIDKHIAHNGTEITPDIVTLAKGLANGVPIGVCISNYEFEKGDHASTFGGNNLACAAANATIDYILENKLMENAVKTGRYMMKELKKLPHIKEVRGKGLMIGAEIEEIYDKNENNNEKSEKIDAKKICEKCMENGLLINNATENTLRFLPPLITKKKHVDAAIKILNEVMTSIN